MDLELPRRLRRRGVELLTRGSEVADDKASRLGCMDMGERPLQRTKQPCLVMPPEEARRYRVLMRCASLANVGCAYAVVGDGTVLKGLGAMVVASEVGGHTVRIEQGLQARYEL